MESTSGYAEGEWTWVPKGQKCHLISIDIAEDRISFDDVASLASKVSDKVSSLIKEEQRQALLGTLNAKESLKDSVQDVRSRFTSFLDGKRRQGFGALTGPLVNYNIIFFHKCIHSKFLFQQMLVSAVPGVAAAGIAYADMASEMRLLKAQFTSIVTSQRSISSTVSSLTTTVSTLSSSASCLNSKVFCCPKNTTCNLIECILIR